MNFLTKSGLATKCSVSRRTVNTWMRDGIIPYLRIKNVVRFDPVAVEEALKHFQVECRGRTRRQSKVAGSGPANPASQGIDAKHSEKHSGGPVITRTSSSFLP